MITLEEFKKMLPSDRDFTDEEILKLHKVMTTFADFAYKDWIEKRKR